MGIFNILEIGRSGLLAHQDAMQTSSNNVSNVNTPNYSRQRPHLQSRSHNLNFGHRVGGGGVDVAKTIRIHDQFIQRQVLEESRNYGNLKARAESLRRIEGITARGMTDLNERVNEFFNNFRELSLNPEIPALQVAVKESAVNLGDGFRKTADSLEVLRNELDLRIGKTVEEINLKAHELADLNRRISSVSPTQEPPHELMDRRNGVVQSLSKMLGVSISHDEQGMMNVIIPGAGILVHGGDANSLETTRTPGDKAKESGLVDIILRTGSGFQYATKGLPSGELGGLLKVRDDTVVKTLKNLDQIAFEFSNKVNDVHRDAVSLDWSYDFNGNLFEASEHVEGSATSLRLDPYIEKNPTAIAIGYEADAPSDNRVALAIAGLQDDKMIGTLGNPEEGQNVQTMNQSISNIISGIASETHGSSEIFAHQSEILDQLENYQKSVSGVSLEEEAVNLMQFQAAFNAAAKTMQVGDEMLETILGLAG